MEPLNGTALCLALAEQVECSNILDYKKIYPNERR